MRFYDLLVKETESDRTRLLHAPLITRALDGTLTRKEYLAFLGQAYHHVKHTVPLLMATGARLPDTREWLRRAVAEYIEEELGHEEWILNDIATCGGDREAVRQSRPAPETELMVAYAYDTVNRVDPVGFFGMVFVLEGTSVRVASRAADRIRVSLQLPESAFSYLSSHGALDLEHMDFFEQLMNRIDDPGEQARIIHCARMFYRLYGDIFRNLTRNPLAAAS